MAVVLDALAPYVKKKITDMAEEEVRMLLGVSNEIKKLEGNVGYFQNYLADAERRRITDRSIQVWVSKLKDAMYEAADILELCQLEAMDRHDDEWNDDGGASSSCLCSLPGLLPEKLQSVLEPFLFCVRNPGFAHDMGTRIKKLNEKLDGIRTDAADFKFISTLSPYDDERRWRSTPAQPARRRSKTTSGFDESAIVGDKIQKDTEELVEMLIANRGSSAAAAIKMVSIVGQGGMGKSTLARKVQASEAIKEEFKTRIWLSVTQHFDRAELLKSAITHAGEKHGDEKDESILEQNLTHILSKKKFLLVLDDVWDDGAWNHVLRVPVVNAGRKQPGSRVLVTSRRGDVVLRMGGSSRDQIRVNKLDDEDAWSLLKKQLPQSEDNAESDFNQLKDIGMEIIKKCDGLPLAIKVMGGLLSTRHLNERDWEIVLNKNLEWKEEGLQEELNYSVHLSYDDLSPQLKQCFLYYSLFPKGSGFIEDVVISMWISEGFIQYDGRSESCQVDLEDIGSEYHRELVERNLLECDESTDNVWDYTMHDIIRSFAQYMASEEAFVVHMEQADMRSLLPAKQKSRRLSIELTDSTLEWNVLENQEALRTLLINCDIRSGGSLVNFASLRVLDIISMKSDWLVDSLCQLRHLRYLSFSHTDISRLPNDIHTMRFLEHIVLENCTKLNKLPDSITKLMRLRYLSIRGSNVDVIPRGLSGLTNLRHVHGFPAMMDGGWCTLEELETLTHLRSLEIESLENVPDSSIAAKAMISNKKHLTYLELNCLKRELGEEEEEEEDQHEKSEDDKENELTEKDEEEEEKKKEHGVDEEKENGEAKEEHDQSEDYEEDEQTEEEEDGAEEEKENEEAKEEHDQSEDEQTDEDEEEGTEEENEQIEENKKVKKEHDQSEDEETKEEVTTEDDQTKKDEDDRQSEDDQGEEEIEEKKEDKEQIDEEHKQIIEAVFNALCPPACLETLLIRRYFGYQLPNWMHASTVAAFKSLRTIDLLQMTDCTRLPDGLCRILSLEELYIKYAPAIKFVGPEFQALASGDGGAIVTRPFPKLRKLNLLGMSGWKNWDWEEEQDKDVAMPSLEHLGITDCKLRYLPPGLASNNRHNLRTLYLENLAILTCVENFPSVVEFEVLYCPKLKRISGLSKLRTIYIDGCPKLKLLEGVPILDTMVLDGEPWEVTGAPAKCTPKGYQGGQPRHLPQKLTVMR